MIEAEKIPSLTLEQIKKEYREAVHKRATLKSQASLMRQLGKRTQEQELEDIEEIRKWEQYSHRLLAEYDKRTEK